MNHIPLLIRNLLVFALWFGTAPIRADLYNKTEHVFSENTANNSYLGKDIAKEYWVVGIARNYPVMDSLEFFGTGQLHPLFGYRFLYQKWLLGMSTQFRFFTDKESREKLSIWTFTQEIFYLTRLYHPFYFLTGTQLSYLLPTKTARFPFTRLPEYSLELGGGLGVGLLYLIDRNSMVALHLNRWRGTKTLIFQGWELSLDYSFHL